jgi:hypothetical protein
MKPTEQDVNLVRMTSIATTVLMLNAVVVGTVKGAGKFIAVQNWWLLTGR